MKKLLLTIVGVASVLTIYAQTSDAEAEAMINLLGVQKKEAMAKLVSVTGKDSIAFWKIYEEYITKNKLVAKDRIKLYEKTAEAYGNMTPASADELAKQYFQNRMNQEKTLEEYFAKVKTATNSVVAFQFYQAEVYLLTMVRAQIMQQIPTYGEVKVAAARKGH
jgi:hypothetical protein